MTRIQERGRGRLKLRLPPCKKRFQLASGQSILEVCEAYELASMGLEYRTRSDTPTSRAIVTDYRELVASLELDAQLYATRDVEES